LEKECSDAVAKAVGREPCPGGLFVPAEILRRDLNVAVAGSGGYLVSGAEHPAGSFIGALRNRSVAMRLGATILPGLRGTATLQRQTGTSSATWLSTETSQIADSQLSIGEIALNPKTVGAHTKLSRQLVLQSNPAAESIVMTDLAATVATAVDLGAINGSGASGQPTGILNTAGIGSVSGTSLDYADIIEFQEDTIGANALINPQTCGYAAPVAIAKLLAGRQKFTGTTETLWAGNLLDGSVGGFRAMSSAQMPTATMLFGDWSQVVIGEWGVLEISSDPFTNFKTAVIGIRCMYTVDVALRAPSSFSAATSIT
jgi:HK97 family phage major capsid protein